MFEAARQACLELGLAVEAESLELGRIYARSLSDTASVFWFGTGYGHCMGIYLTRLEDGRTKVETATQKVYRLDVAFTDYREQILDRIGAHLQGKTSQEQGRGRPS